jgi:UDP-N-acetylmuramoylalanine--D-glutamate ligase
MRNKDYFKNKRVIIVGLARSGLACADLLYGLGAKVSVTDNQDSPLTRANRQKLRDPDVSVELGRHTKDLVKDQDLLVISPGVPNDALPILWAREFRIPVISEIECAWMLCPGTVTAITGSNGKTTVTTLIGRMIEAAKHRAFVCGNIGDPFSGEVANIREKDFVSLEVSSFQLENITSFKPKIAVILNLTRNHLDRYRSMQEYRDAKKRIFMNQDESDHLVLNGENPFVKELAKETKARVVYFSQTKELNPNQAAVMAVGDLLGIDQDLTLKVLRDFKGLKHRQEEVAQVNCVKFINDSKATTADSTLWALGSISSPVILIAGGRDKGVDYGVILELARRKVKNLILLGEAKEKIASSLKGLAMEEAATMEEAVAKAYQRALPGDCVLLSPMCSSFDMFSDYEERGEVFKRAVFDLAKNTAKINSNAKIQNPK